MTTNNFLILTNTLTEDEVAKEFTRAFYDSLNETFASSVVYVSLTLIIIFCILLIFVFAVQTKTEVDGKEEEAIEDEKGYLSLLVFKAKHTKDFVFNILDFVPLGKTIPEKAITELNSLCAKETLITQSKKYQEIPSHYQDIVKITFIEKRLEVLSKHMDINIYNNVSKNMTIQKNDFKYLSSRTRIRNVRVRSSRG